MGLEGRLMLGWAFGVFLFVVLFACFFFIEGFCGYART